MATLNKNCVYLSRPLEHSCCLQSPQCLLRNSTVSPILLHSPICSPPGQSQPVSTYKSPGTVDKFANDLRWTSIQLTLDSCCFGLFNILLLFLPISVFGPSPVLVQLLDTCYGQENMLTISMGFNSQWNLGRKITSCPLLLINSSTSET